MGLMNYSLGNLHMSTESISGSSDQVNAGSDREGKPYQRTMENEELPDGIKEYPTCPIQEPIGPFQWRLWPLDQQLRKDALDSSLGVVHGWNTKDKWDAEQVVEMSEKFYKFLKGDL